VDMIYPPSAGMALIEKKSGADVLPTTIYKHGRSALAETSLLMDRFLRLNTMEGAQKSSG